MGFFIEKKEEKIYEVFAVSDNLGVKLLKRGVDLSEAERTAEEVRKETGVYAVVRKVKTETPPSGCLFCEHLNVKYNSIAEQQTSPVREHICQCKDCELYGQDVTQKETKSCKYCHRVLKTLSEDEAELYVKMDSAVHYCELRGVKYKVNSLNTILVGDEIVDTSTISTGELIDCIEKIQSKRRN